MAKPKELNDWGERDGAAVWDTWDTLTWDNRIDRMVLTFVQLFETTLFKISNNLDRIHTFKELTVPFSSSKPRIRVQAHP